MAETIHRGLTEAEEREFDRLDELGDRNMAEIRGDILGLEEARQLIDSPQPPQLSPEEQREVNRRGNAVVRAIGEFAARPDIKALPKEERDLAIEQEIERLNADPNL